MKDSGLTVKAAAKYLGVSPDTIRRYTDKGFLKHTRHPINNYRIVSRKDLDKLRNCISTYR